MNRVIVKVSVLTMLTCGSCSSSDGPAGMQDGDQQAKQLAIVATVNGAASAEDVNYKHDNFIKDRSIIRVVNTVNYATPDFTDPSAYREYIYTDDKVAEADNLPNFFPLKAGSQYGATDRVDEDGGFDWDMIQPTSNAFVFEAACYPMKYEPFTEITQDQSIKDNFWSADLLLAHTRKALDERYDLLQLKFWHVFSMIRIELQLPIADSNADTGFPAHSPENPTIEQSTLKSMYVTYETRYAESISNQGRHTVVGTSDGGRHDIIMYRLPDSDEEIEDPDTGQRYQKCMFAAIVPTQQIRTQETLLELDINTIVGFDGDDMGHQLIEKKTYVFKPSTSLEMTQGQITVLKLGVNTDTWEPILLSASVAPWTESYTDVNLMPVD